MCRQGLYTDVRQWPPSVYCCWNLIASKSERYENIALICWEIILHTRELASERERERESKDRQLCMWDWSTIAKYVMRVSIPTLNCATVAYIVEAL